MSFYAHDYIHIYICLNLYLLYTNSVYMNVYAMFYLNYKNHNLTDVMDVTEFLIYILCNR